MKVKKEILAILLLAALVLTGCGTGAGSQTVPNQKSGSANEPAEQNAEQEKSASEIPKLAKGKTVAAVYLGNDIQPFTEEDGDTEQLDTIWVYYDDNTFEQFAEVDDKLEQFSEGTYALQDDIGFLYNDTNGALGGITITRTKKYQDGKGLADYSSEHSYELASLEYCRLYPNQKDGKKLDAIFYGVKKQPYTEADGDEEMLDTVWLYYSDSTYEQYAIVDGSIVLFSTGTYEFPEGGDFLYEENESDSGKITINSSQQFIAGEGLEEYSSSNTYALNTLGLVRVFAAR